MLTPHSVLRVFLRICGSFLALAASQMIDTYYGLRISDVATMSKDSVKGADIRLRAAKNRKAVWHERYPVVREALDALPVPISANADCPYFFWTG